MQTGTFNVRVDSTPDALKRAATEGEKLGRDVKASLEDAMARGRGIANDVADAATDDLTARGRGAADRAREYMKDGRERASALAGRVSNYADENTAIVAVAAFGVGLLVGHLATRRR